MPKQSRNPQEHDEHYPETARPNNKTNIERVTEFMEWHSPMHQAFVMQAITNLAEQILRDEGALREKMKANGSADFIPPEVWIKCAQDWKKENPEYFG